LTRRSSRIEGSFEIVWLMGFVDRACKVKEATTRADSGSLKPRCRPELASAVQQGLKDIKEPA
jgi:hypothetical protein